MKQLPLFDLMRVWAAMTGLVIAVIYFGALTLGLTPSPVLPLLLAAIGGFELFLFVQDIVLARSGKARR
ncbi:hypothetical protein [Novosphingobium sp. JCM 18896]|uniref:hypothetical protein n=1 Tax=Novosphingobium sp. JCM 18896 TaxID=2989731 RepID=UPI0022230F3A|nr:hypothetical protein [Novosphingobium sp. JCM 18896]MCW1430044.1 hypothetical protein [Novosphingobium sp. JCM 18896]